MKRIILLLVMLIVILSGCTTDKELKEKKKQTQLQNQTRTQNIVDLSVSSLFRESETKDSNGFFKRPYIKAGVIFSLDKSPEDNAGVTIIPIGVDLPSFNAQINAAEENSLDNDNSTINWYNISMNDILNKDVLNAEPLPGRRDDTPFDVCCIYPAVDKARTIEIDTAVPEQLPKENIKNIKCLIDTNEDNKPDLVIAQEKDGEYTITRYYIKENNIWSLFKQHNPM